MRRLALFSLLLAGTFSAAVPRAEAFKFELVISGSELIFRGKTALRTGMVDQAIAFYEEALGQELSRRDIQRAHNDLCVAHYFKREFQTAIDYCTIAIQMAPNIWSGYNNRANVFMEIGAFDQARADYEKGLILSPESDVLATNLGILTDRQNKAQIAADGGEATVEVQENIMLR